MFLVEAEEQTFYSLKPMNCPESTFIYRSRVRSYREFPLRLSEYGVLHRNELSGVPSGLTRVRHFYTDDAHIYVEPAQIQDRDPGADGRGDASSTRWFGLEPTAHVRDASRPRRWATSRRGVETEAMMLEALEARRASSYRVKEGDGAFYAPKIDIQIEDALGREWQTATIQVDRLMLPERFDLHYIDEHGERQRPVAIHRAILGSLERFIGVITEHFARRVSVLVRAGSGHRHSDCGSPQRGGRVARRACCRARGLRVEVDDSVQPDAEQDPPRAGAEGARTCSSWAIARSRHGRPRHARGQGSSSRPSAGTNSPIGLQQRPPRGVRTSGSVRAAYRCHFVPAECHVSCRENDITSWRMATTIRASRGGFMRVF